MSGDVLTMSMFEEGEEEDVDLTEQLNSLLEKSRGTRHEQQMIQMIKDRVFEAEKQHYDEELERNGDTGVLSGFDDTLLDAFSGTLRTSVIHHQASSSSGDGHGYGRERGQGGNHFTSEAKRQEARMSGLAVPSLHRTWKERPVARAKWASTNHLGRQRPAPSDASGRGAAPASTAGFAQSPRRTRGTEGYTIDQRHFENWIDSKYSWYRQSREKIEQRKKERERAAAAAARPRLHARTSAAMAERVKAKVALSEAGMLDSVRLLKSRERRGTGPNKSRGSVDVNAGSPKKQHVSNVAFGTYTSEWKDVNVSRDRSPSPSKRSPDKGHTISQDVFSRLYKYKDIYAEKMAARAEMSPSKEGRPETPRRICPGTEKILEKKGVQFREQGKFVVPEKTLEDYVAELGLEEVSPKQSKSTKGFSTAPKYGTNRTPEPTMNLRKEFNMDWTNPLNGSFEGSSGVSRGMAFGPSKPVQPNSLRESIARRKSSHGRGANNTTNGTPRRSRSASPSRSTRRTGSASDAMFRPLLMSSKKERERVVQARGTFEERIMKEVERYETKRAVAIKQSYTPGPGAYNTLFDRNDALSTPTARCRSASPSRAGMGPHYDGSVRSYSPGRRGYRFSTSNRGL